MYEALEKKIGGCIRVAFSCVEEQDIPDLFEPMFQCAPEMASDGASLPQAAPQGAFEE